MNGASMQIDLPRVVISYDDHWELAVTVDHEPYDIDALSPVTNRRDPRQVASDVADDLGKHVYVQATRPDGAVFHDVVEHGARSLAQSQESPASLTTATGTGVVGGGFEPGEEVTVAVVVTTLTADAHGDVSLALPPALMRQLRFELVLAGRRGATAVTHRVDALDPAAGS